MKPHNYRINPRFARSKGIPSIVLAMPLMETDKALYLYGHGSLEVAVNVGMCCRCGAILTHPGSVTLGIGPECLGDWSAREFALAHMTEREKAAFKEKVAVERPLDSWVPKSVVKDLGESLQELEIPEEHPMIIKKQEKPLPSVEGVSLAGDTLIVKFPYDPEKVQQMREIPGRYWNSGLKQWEVPANAVSVAKLVGAGFDVPSIEKPKPKRASIDMTGFGRQLFPFQREGVEFMHAKGGRALVADEMGLGKTIQALAYIHSRPDLRPAVVICPASLKWNWEREARVACPNISTCIVSGKAKQRLPRADLYIINYDIVADRMDDLLNTGLQLMVIDECHYLKNKKAKRTKAIIGSNKAQGLSVVPHIIALSGTPIINRPVEIYPVAKMLGGASIPPFMTFAHRYCGAHRNTFGWDFTGATNKEELNSLLTSTIMIRHTKSEVLSELPDKRRVAIPVDMDASAWGEYNKAHKNFIEWVKHVDPEKVEAAQRAEFLVQLQALKRIAVRGKWNDTLSWIKDSLDNDGKLIVFAVHHETIDKLMSVLSSYNPVKIDGRDSQEARQSAVDRFQNDEAVRVFVGNIKAAGVGLTLTAAANVAFVELGWTPGEHTQAEDRAHRIGQKNAVVAYYLVAANTIEEEIAALLDRKQQVLDAVLDGKQSDEGSMLSELLTRYSK